MIGRRQFITLLGGAAAAWPLAGRAQQPAVPVIGVLRPIPKDVDQFAEPFRRYMRAIGWEDGRNVRFLFVWAEGRNERAPALAEQLIAQNVDVIVTFADPAIRAVQRATQNGRASGRSRMRDWCAGGMGALASSATRRKGSRNRSWTPEPEAIRQSGGRRRGLKAVLMTDRANLFDNYLPAGRDRWPARRGLLLVKTQISVAQRRLICRVEVRASRGP